MKTKTKRTTLVLHNKSVEIFVLRSVFDAKVVVFKA